MPHNKAGVPIMGDGNGMRDSKLRETTQNLVAVFDDLEQKTGRRSGYWIARCRIDALREALANTTERPEKCPRCDQRMVPRYVGIKLRCKECDFLWETV